MLKKHQFSHKKFLIKKRIHAGSCQKKKKWLSITCHPDQCRVSVTSHSDKCRVSNVSGGRNLKSILHWTPYTDLSGKWQTPYTDLGDNLWTSYTDLSDNLWTSYTNPSENLWTPTQISVTNGTRILKKKFKRRKKMIFFTINHVHCNPEVFTSYMSR